MKGVVRTFAGKTSMAILWAETKGNLVLLECAWEIPLSALMKSMDNRVDAIMLPQGIK